MENILFKYGKGTWIKQLMHQEAGLLQIVPSLDLDNNEDISILDVDVCQDILVNPTAQATLSSACSEDSEVPTLERRNQLLKNYLLK